MYRHDRGVSLCARRVDCACSYARGVATCGIRARTRVNMMMRHRRLPAIAVLVAMVAFGLIYVRSWGRGAAGEAGSLAELEKQIATGKDVPVSTWGAYAQKLMEAKRFDDAAGAFKKVLDKEP